jgi:hypothetical protein
MARAEFVAMLGRRRGDFFLGHTYSCEFAIDVLDEKSAEIGEDLEQCWS